MTANGGTGIARWATITAIIFCGAIFGFFYAWICSTMWGLDNADPRVAIAAMQEMNASVRNAVFFPAFFLTPAVTAIAAWLCYREGAARAARLLLVAAIVYLVGGLILTGTVNVPMNNDLGDKAIPAEIEAARTIWEDYSGRWQVFNVIRTVASGISLLLAAMALFELGRAKRVVAGDRDGGVATR